MATPTNGLAGRHKQRVFGQLSAVQSGCFAALASVSAKVATDFESSRHLLTFLTSLFDTLLNIPPPIPETESQLCYVVRAIGIYGIFQCNALMWVLFTKAMHQCSSTLEATGFNTVANFFVTAIIGRVLFQEKIALQWYAGSFLMVIGLVILHKYSGQEGLETCPSEDVGQSDLPEDKKVS